jgi:hypothetical protein
MAYDQRQAQGQRTGDVEGGGQGRGQAMYYQSLACQAAGWGRGQSGRHWRDSPDTEAVGQPEPA